MPSLFSLFALPYPLSSPLLPPFGGPRFIMAEDNPNNGAVSAGNNGEGDIPADPPGIFGIEEWGNEGWAYDSNNNRRAQPAMVVRENGTTGTLWDCLQPNTTTPILALDGSLL